MDAADDLAVIVAVPCAQCLSQRRCLFSPSIHLSLHKLGLNWNELLKIFSLAKFFV